MSAAMSYRYDYAHSDLSTHAERFIAATEAFQAATRRDLPIQHMLVFMTVARYPGKSQIEYARQMHSGDVNQSTISRHLTDLSIELRTREPGYGLVEFKTNVKNRRENIYYLSAKGEELYKRMLSLLGE